MPIEHRTALLKLRAFVGGNATMLAEDMLRTTLKAVAMVIDPRSRAELETKLVNQLIALGVTPRSSPRKKLLRRKVEATLDLVEQASRKRFRSTSGASMINNRITGLD
jgi:hypothetical protein